MKKLLLLVAMVATFIGLSAQNPYAYKLSAMTGTTNSMRLFYTLNAQAQAVQIQVFDGETQVKAIDMGEDMLTAGNHEYVIHISDLPEDAIGKNLSWKVAVTGETLEAPVELTDKVLKFYSPAGVAVDVNPESDNFGTMYVTESYASSSTAYYTAPDNGAVGCGLYQFDPQFNGIKNEEGKYGFNCGMLSTGAGAGSLIDWRPARIQISEDGRMFILSQRVNTGYPLYEINRATLQATPLFEGTLDTSTGIVTNGEVEVAAGVGVAFDVIGKGENLKLMMMTCTPGTTTDVTKYKTNEYNLGTATSWGDAPSRNFTAFDNKAINYAGINLAYDGAGGIWMSQWRGAPTEGEPSYAHASLETEEIDQLITDIYSRNGGMAFNKDHTLMVRGEGYSKKLVVYAVNNGELTKLYEYSCPSFTGWNHFAFDYANNIIACDNSAEVFGMIQLPNENAVVTPCAEDYNFGFYPDDIEEMYVVGTFNGWSQENGMAELVFNEDNNNFVGDVELEAGAEFKIITPVGDDEWRWFGGVDENNVGYFLINNDILNDPYNEIMLVDGANFKVEEAGTYEITVQVLIPTKGNREISWDTVIMHITKKAPQAITTISNDKVDNAWYNMNGIRFENKPAAPGIYIHNGKKVLVK
ncbi:MAG: SusF/SusE family outer membrane protein [Muribaculaceae bacterium]|nr:SusF/SusE family outer membrane protein [Muribaculaceae bacterium]MBR6490027.1 SusF/SusE family outer membrane protein [Muribaculaceae bacterium]